MIRKPPRDKWLCMARLSVTKRLEGESKKDVDTGEAVVVTGCRSLGYESAAMSSTETRSRSESLLNEPLRGL